jgi:PPOX class probable F420-dependent enzyme
MSIPSAISGQRYISLATFRKTGAAVYTPVWFAEENDHLYVMTASKLGKTKRLRNNPNVKIAPCTIRGKITGPEFSATARFVSPDQHRRVRQLINDKYFLARLSFLFPRTDTYIEITPDPA